jgi:hypothetical protein
LPLGGVILNGLQAVKDLARGGSNLALGNALDEPRACPDARRILHPAEAGFRMTPVRV